jgi:DNA end-binding protein Ku
LVEALGRSTRLDGPDFEDRYTGAIARIVEAKREEEPLPASPETEQSVAVLDLMAALQEPVSKVKSSRGESPGRPRCASR